MTLGNVLCTLTKYANDLLTYFLTVGVSKLGRGANTDITEKKQTTQKAGVCVVCFRSVTSMFRALYFAPQ